MIDDPGLCVCEYRLWISWQRRQISVYLTFNLCGSCYWQRKSSEICTTWRATVPASILLASLHTQAHSQFLKYVKTWFRANVLQKLFCPTEKCNFFVNCRSEYIPLRCWDPSSLFFSSNVARATGLHPEKWLLETYPPCPGLQLCEMSGQRPL